MHRSSSDSPWIAGELSRVTKAQQEPSACSQRMRQYETCRKSDDSSHPKASKLYDSSNASSSCAASLVTRGRCTPPIKSKYMVPSNMLGCGTCAQSGATSSAAFDRDGASWVAATATPTATLTAAATTDTTTTACVVAAAAPAAPAAATPVPTEPADACAAWTAICCSTACGLLVIIVDWMNKKRKKHNKNNT